MAAVAQRDVYVDGAGLLAIVEEWASRGQRLYACLSDGHAKLIGELRAGRVQEVELGRADRLLVAIDQQHRLWEIAPEPEPLPEGVDPW